jgi:hypothetical protein
MGCSWALLEFFSPSSYFLSRGSSRGFPGVALRAPAMRPLSSLKACHVGERSKEREAHAACRGESRYAKIHVSAGPPCASRCPSLCGVCGSAFSHGRRHLEARCGWRGSAPDSCTRGTTTEAGSHRSKIGGRVAVAV